MKTEILPVFEIAAFVSLLPYFFLIPAILKVSLSFNTVIMYYCYVLSLYLELFLHIRTYGIIISCSQAANRNVMSLQQVYLCKFTLYRNKVNFGYCELK